MAVPVFEWIGGEVVTEAFEAAWGVQLVGKATIVVRRFYVIAPDDGKPPITEIGQQRDLVVAKESEVCAVSFSKNRKVFFFNSKSFGRD